MMGDDEYLECAICYQRIYEYDWYIQVRRQENPLYIRVAHHTCPPEQEQQGRRR